MKYFESYEEQYRNEISGKCGQEIAKEYRTTIGDFEKWLDENDMRQIFFRDLNKEYLYVDETEQIFFTATDYSIPAVMVKYYKRAMKRAMAKCHKRKR